MSRRTVLSAVKASAATSLRTAAWRSGFCLLGALLPLASGGDHSSRSQRLRTCVDRWNQGNMVGWGPGPVNVAFRRPNAKEHSSIQLSSSRVCIVGIAVGDGTWTCVMSSTGAYWCPPLHEATGPRPVSGAESRSGRVTGRWDIHASTSGTASCGTSTLREKPCSCWVKVGRGPRSLPATR
jgi:hypothetical protein